MLKDEAFRRLRRVERIHVGMFEEVADCEHDCIGFSDEINVVEIKGR